MLNLRLDPQDLQSLDAGEGGVLLVATPGRLASHAGGPAGMRFSRKNPNWEAVLGMFLRQAGRGRVKS